jgi:tellurite resistance protein TehA-like permease
MMNIVVDAPRTGPLGQGGYALLLHGENAAMLLPLHFGGNFPFIEYSGQMIFAVCFAGAFILWSMGIAWITVAILSIFSVVRKGKISFSMAYWGMVFPHGTFASLSVKMALVLDSPFYRAFGALWCCTCLLNPFSSWRNLTRCFDRRRFQLVAVDIHAQHPSLHRRFAVQGTLRA